MATSIITPDDLEQFKWELLDQIKQLLDKKVDKPVSQEQKRVWIKSHLFNEPYHGYLLKELLEFCEEDSKEVLQMVLLGEKVEEPVVFKSNFMKRSLRDPLKTLISKGDMKMNQKECAKWLHINFRIRKNNGVDEFSVDGTHDAFGTLPTQTENSQLKFDDWYKITNRK